MRLLIDIQVYREAKSQGGSRGVAGCEHPYEVLVMTEIDWQGMKMSVRNYRRELLNLMMSEL